MADGSGLTSNGFRTLTFDEVNRINSLACQVKGIAAVLRCAASNLDECDDESIAGACWAIEDLVGQMDAIATSKKETGNG